MFFVTILKIGLVILPIGLAIVLGIASKRWSAEELNKLFWALMAIVAALGFALPFITLWKGFDWSWWLAVIVAVVIFFLTSFVFFASEFEEDEGYDG